MNDQTTKEIGQAGTPDPASPSPDTSTLKAARPVPITRPKDTTEKSAAAAKSAKIAPRKDSSAKKGKKNKAGRSSQSGAPKNAAPARKKSRFTRKQIIVGLIIFIIVFDVALVGLLFLNRGGNAPPHTDPYALIQGQMSNNRAIAEVGYDSALTFANYTDLTIVNTSSLKPIENDLLKSGAGPDGKDVYYDEQIVGRILKLNSDWVSHLNQGDQAVFSSVREGSAAQSKLAELGAGSGVAYHRLAIGEIRHTGKNYYIITRASYTLTKDGQLDIHDDLFVYKLIAQNNTMIVIDFEQIAPNASAEQSLDTQPATPDEMPLEPSDETMTGDVGETTTGESGEGTAEEPGETTPTDEPGETPSENPDENPAEEPATNP
jgi:hypothetical protein